ncbi:MAG: PQQ-binding-like beta-propeller repeat protein [Hyphomicrobiaceae bacterium]
MGSKSVKFSASCGSLVILATVLAGCSSGLPKLPKVADLNPFAQKQKPLPGKRIPVLPAREVVPGELAVADQAIVVPPPSVNQAWAYPGGAATNAPGHLSLGATLTKGWSASAGKGSSKAGRITATPIVYGGRAYTLDARGTISAFNLASGARAWQVSLKPDTETVTGGDFFSLGSGDSATGGYGGGIAAEEGKIFAASGYGLVAALNPASGKKIWDRNLNTPLRAAPTVSNGRVFIVTIDGRTYCLSAVDGVELWVVRGLPQTASIVSSVSPAVLGDTVVVPYPSGDLVALNVADGTTKWTENLARSRATSQMASLSDAASPAISDGVVYAVGHAGRMVATKIDSGERLWSSRVPGTQTPYVAGGSVFVVDTSGQLMALSRKSGNIQWTMKIPGESRTWVGPVLAGGALRVVSSKGEIVSVEPTSGKVLKKTSIGSPVYVAPIVAQNRMLVLTDDAELYSLN